MVSVYLYCKELPGASVPVSCDWGAALGDTAGLEGGPVMGLMVDPVPIMFSRDTTVHRPPPPKLHHCQI